MVVEDIKSLLKMHNKGWLSIDEILIKCGKSLHNNFQIHIKDYF